jgi:hypothetical protein
VSAPASRSEVGVEGHGSRETLTEGRWPRTVKEAERVQPMLAERVRVPSDSVPVPRLVTGLDVLLREGARTQPHFVGEHAEPGLNRGRTTGRTRGATT